MLHCENDPTFIDANRYVCLQWTADDCFRDTWGARGHVYYTPAQLADVRRHCTVQCGTCFADGYDPNAIGAGGVPGAFVESPPSLPAPPAPPLVCEDDPTFVDQHRYTCAGWAPTMARGAANPALNYNCYRATWGAITYTDEGLAELRASCPAACQLCTPTSKASFHKTTSKHHRKHVLKASAPSKPTAAPATKSNKRSIDKKLHKLHNVLSEGADMALRRR